MTPLSQELEPLANPGRLTLDLDPEGRVVGHQPDPPLLAVALGLVARNFAFVLVELFDDVFRAGRDR